MVCEKCEKKLSKSAVPDVWKDGSRNAGAGRDGGRSVARNTMLGSGRSFAPHLKTCRICKTKLSQDAIYCNPCAFSKGICAMCGVAVADLRMDKRGAEWPSSKRDALAALGGSSAEKRSNDEEREDGGGDPPSPQEGAESRGHTGKMALGGVDDDQPPKKKPKGSKSSSTAAAAAASASQTGLLLEAISRRTAAAKKATIADARTAPLQQQPVSREHLRDLQADCQGEPPASSSSSSSSWSTAMDAATGKTYYYHRETGATQWDPPADVTPASSSSSSSSRDESVAQQHETAPEHAKWKSAVDAATGRTYHYHVDTGETKWATTTMT